MSKHGQDRGSYLYSAGRCPTCGKIRWLSRKDAKLAAKRTLSQQGRGKKLNAYACGDYWHIGHPPPELGRGTTTRDNVRNVRVR